MLKNIKKDVKKKSYEEDKGNNVMVKNILTELKEHKELLFGTIQLFIKFIVQENTLDDGSDSNPSEDNIDSKELLDIIPELDPKEKAKINATEAKIETIKKTKSDLHSRDDYLPRKVIEEQKKESSMTFNKKRLAKIYKPVSFKKTNAFVQYIETVDSWTQTSIHEEPVNNQKINNLDQFEVNLPDNVLSSTQPIVPTINSFNQPAVLSQPHEKKINHHAKNKTTHLMSLPANNPKKYICLKDSGVPSSGILGPTPTSFPRFQPPPTKPLAIIGNNATPMPEQKITKKKGANQNYSMYEPNEATQLYYNIKDSLRREALQLAAPIVHKRSFINTSKPSGQKRSNNSMFLPINTSSEQNGDRIAKSICAALVKDIGAAINKRTVKEKGAWKSDKSTTNDKQRKKGNSKTIR